MALCGAVCARQALLAHAKLRASDTKWCGCGKRRDAPAHTHTQITDISSIMLQLRYIMKWPQPPRKRRSGANRAARASYLWPHFCTVSRIVPWNWTASDSGFFSISEHIWPVYVVAASPLFNHFYCIQWMGKSSRRTGECQRKFKFRHVQLESQRISR